MANKLLSAELVLAILLPVASNAQGTSTGFVGWYNGDWRGGLSSPSNWYTSAQKFSRVYDDFFVPDGGWTVVAVFSNNDIPASTVVTQASWEIRSGLSAGNPGTLVASGLSSAAQTQVAGAEYRIQVSGLWLELPPGQYWLSVTPVMSGSSYVCSTLGGNAIGNPAGNDGQAFSYDGNSFKPAQASGINGTTSDFSQGILISGAPLPRILAWPADLISLAQQMESNHSVPYPGISMDDFNARLEDLVANVPLLSDAEVRTGMQALVSSIGDPHTDIEWPSPPPFNSLPLTFYWFDDGMYIINAPAQYQDLLGGKLVSIGGSSTDDAIQALKPLLAYDNDSWLKSLLPANRLNNTDFLFGTGVADSTDVVTVQVQTASGDVLSMDVQAMNRNQFLHMLSAYQGDLPLYRQHTDKYYWSTIIDGGATVYFQYNSCSEDPTLPSAVFLAQLNQTLAQTGVQRLIVDMRNNTGGSASILDNWILGQKTGRFNQRGRLYVITGRATFSAAMEATDFFHDNTAAIFVGEPTGGKPRFLLRRGDFGLPYFGLRVSFSNGTEGAANPDSTQMPDIQTPVTFENYMQGVDPALDAILSAPLP